MCESKKVSVYQNYFFKAAADPSLRPQGNEGSQGSKMTILWVISVSRLMMHSGLKYEKSGIWRSRAELFIS